MRDADGFVVDPRHGQCNAAPDRWAVSHPYEDPHIDTLGTWLVEAMFAGQTCTHAFSVSAVHARDLGEVESARIQIAADAPRCATATASLPCKP